MICYPLPSTSHGSDGDPHCLCCPKDTSHVVTTPRMPLSTLMQLHGFCDASEDAYAGVVYTRVQDGGGNIHISLVVSKTKVAPIKRLTIPRLELCGAQLLAKLLHHTKQALNIPTQSVD